MCVVLVVLGRWEGPAFPSNTVLCHIHQRMLRAYEGRVDCDLRVELWTMWIWGMNGLEALEGSFQDPFPPC